MSEKATENSQAENKQAQTNATDEPSENESEEVILEREPIDGHKLKLILEAGLLAAGRPMSLDSLIALFPDADRPGRADIRDGLAALSEDYAERALELVEVASGYRVQVKADYCPWVSRLWDERPPRYSRALMETLAIIAYRQPITRGEIEDVRGVSVSSNIIRTLLERDWIRAVGHRDVPGKPALFGTTRDFLDYFGLKRLDELPTLEELRDLDEINVELDLGLPPAVIDAARGEALQDGEEGDDDAATKGDAADSGAHEGITDDTDADADADEDEDEDADEDEDEDEDLEDSDDDDDEEAR